MKPDPFKSLGRVLFTVAAIASLFAAVVEKSHAVELPAPAPGITKDYPVTKDAVYQVTTKADVAGVTAPMTRQFLVVGEGGNEIMAINGVPMTEALPPADLPKGSFYFRGQPVFHRPDKPEQLRITVYTADGKKWRAVWEPEK